MTTHPTDTTNTAPPLGAPREAHQKADGDMPMPKQGFVAGYTFKIDHNERHYLMNPKGRSYSTAMTRDKSMAMRFSTTEAARSAIEKKLDKTDRGRSMGYYFASFVESAS